MRMKKPLAVVWLQGSFFFIKGKIHIHGSSHFCLWPCPPQAHNAFKVAHKGICDLGWEKDSPTSTTPKICCAPLELQ